MITVEFAEAFAQEWVESWNTHNIEIILQHYSDDFIIETPMAQRLLPGSNGVVRGKSEVRKYWQIGLERIPDLKFEILDVLTGVNGLGIYYINKATNRKTVEWMCFNADGKVGSAIVGYSG